MPEAPKIAHHEFLCVLKSQNFENFTNLENQSHKFSIYAPTYNREFVRPAERGQD